MENNSTQIVQTFTNMNPVQIRSQDDFHNVTDFIDQRYIRDKISMKIRSVFPRYEPNCGKIPDLTMSKNPFKIARSGVVFDDLPGLENADVISTD